MTKNTIERLLVGSSMPALLALLAAMPVAAYAAAPSGQLQEIVITAQKKTENLQKAAITVQALSAKQIDKEGIKSPLDLQVMLPAVHFVQANVASISIRGVGTDNLNAGVDSAVAYSVDGIYLSHSPALPPVLFDIARVEAVLGPQGTLYGRNSNGGALNFITNSPTNKFEGSASVQFGNYGTVGTEAMINIPLTDELAMRVAMGSNRHNAYLSDGYDDDDAVGGRAKIAYTPNASLKVLLSADASTDNSHGTFFSYCPPHSIVPICQGQKFQPFAGEPTQTLGYHHNNIVGVGGEIDYDFGWANLTSLTGYRIYHNRDFNPSPHAPTNGFGYLHDQDDYFFTQEVRLASEKGSAINWIAGLYYSQERQPDLQVYDFYFVPGKPYFPYSVPNGIYTSKAVFADATYPVLSNFRLEGGMRFTSENKDASGNTTIEVPGVGQVAPYTLTGGKSTENRVTWKAGLNWDITPENMFYATASTGFKSGGVNQVSVASGLPTTYAPETILAEEAGFKNRFLDNRLQVNVDGFHYDYKGFQVYGGINLPVGLFFATLNSQQATFFGGELDAKYRLTDVDQLGVTGSILHARFDKFVVPNLGDFSGNQAPDAPRYQVGLNYQHTFMLNNADDVNFNINSDLVGPQHVDYTNSPGSIQDFYTRSGVSITYERADNWTVTAYIRNIENAGVLNGWGGPAPGETPQDNGTMDPPRTFGVTVKKSF